MIKRVALVFNLLMVVVFSFPSQTIVEYKTQQPKSSDQFSTDNIDEPMIVIVEEKDTKSSGSVIVQFVYNGNTMGEREGMKSEMYNIAPNPRDQAQLNNSDVTEENKSNSDATSQKPEDITLKKDTKSKAEEGKKKLKNEKLPVSKKTEWIPKLYNTAPMPEKKKYLADISTFPEIMYGKGKGETYIQPKTFLVDSKFGETPKFSEPVLYPKTIYNTEFDIPFF